MILTVFRYLNLISMDFYDFIQVLRFLLSISFDWEDISNTQDSVSPLFQSTSKFVKKYSATGRIFNSISFLINITSFSHESVHFSNQRFSWECSSYMHDVGFWEITRKCVFVVSFFLLQNTFFFAISGCRYPFPFGSFTEKALIHII